MKPASHSRPARGSLPRRAARSRTRRAPGSPSDAEAPLASSLRPRGPAQLELTTREHPDATYLLAAGEVDVLTAPKLAATLVCLLHNAQGDVVVDLSETVFMDSAGLHVLLNARRRLTRQHRRLRVICGSGPVRRVIELARLLDTLDVGPEE